ncbi:phospholipase-like protein [Tanacetum coccineum]
MDNMNEVFDAKFTLRGNLHTLTSIKELLGQTGNERRGTRFCSTVFGKWLDFPAYSNDNLLLNYIFQHEVKQEQNNDICPPIRYKIGNNHFDRQEFCLITGFAFGKIPKSALSDEDSVKVCLLLVSNIVFIGHEFKNYIAYTLIELVDDLTVWDTYPWGDYFWRALYRSSKKIETYNVYGFVWSLKIYILEMYRNNKFWWKRDLLVIPRGLAWSKIGKVKKGDYGALFAEWSNPILSMAPMSTELLQSWLIRSMDYFQILLVDEQPKDPITASPQGIQQNICDAVVHDPQFEQQSKQEMVSIVLKELAAVKQRMNAIERFIKSRNDNLTEDSVAKQFVEKEIEYSDGKPDSAISDVFIGEISCENLLQEQLQSRDMCIQSTGNQFVQHPLESPNGKLPEILISGVLNGEVSFDKKRPNIYHCESSKNEALFEEFDPKEYDKNVHESGDGKESTQFNRKRNKKEPIRQSQIVLKEIPLVEFHEDLSRAPYSQRTKVKLPECIDMVYALGDETSYIFPWGNNDIVVYRSFWLNLLGLKEGGWLSDKHLDAWFELMGNFRPTNADWAIASSYFCDFVMREIFLDGSVMELDAKGIPLEGYNIKFVIRKDVPIQGGAYGDCRVWVCIFLYRLIHKMAVSARDPQIVGLAYREHMFDYFWKYKIAN